MLSLCLIWCTFVALGDPFSSATAFWWSLHWSLNRSLTVLPGSVEKYLTHNPGSWVRTALDRLDFCGSANGQDILESQPSTGETQERHEKCELLP